MKLSSAIASIALTASAKAYVTTGSRVQKREVMADKPSTLTMTHLSPIVIVGGGLNDPDQVYGLDVNVQIPGGAFLTDIPVVFDIEEPNLETGTGGVGVKYYRRIFGGESTPGRVTVNPQQGQEENTEVQIPGGRVVDTSPTCYFLTRTDRSELENPNSPGPSNVRYIESEDALFLKSESFGLGTPFDANGPYDGIECE